MCNDDLYGKSLKFNVGGLTCSTRLHVEILLSPWLSNVLNEMGPTDEICAPCADMQSRQCKGQSALVLNLEIRDSHEEAASGAKLALELCQMVRSGTLNNACMVAFFVFAFMNVLLNGLTSLVADMDVQQLYPSHVQRTYNGL